MVLASWNDIFTFQDVIKNEVKQAANIILNDKYVKEWYRIAKAL